MGDALNFLSDPKLQGVLALIAIVQAVFAFVKELPSIVRAVSSSWKGLKGATEQPISKTGLAVKILMDRIRSVGVLRILGFFLLGWFFYCLPWVLLTMAFKWEFANTLRMVASLSFLLLSTSVLFGGLMTRPRHTIGHFLGGGLSLGGLAVYYTYISPALLDTASRQTWFVVFMIIGGMFGMFSGMLTYYVVDVVNIWRTRQISKDSKVDVA